MESSYTSQPRKREEYDSFLATLAAYLWMQTFTAWEKKEWHKLDILSQLALFLQPHEMTYYDLASWHMAWNASADAEAAGNNVMRDHYTKRGRYFLEQGIANNPNSSFLYERLGLLLRDRCHDHAAAANAFAQAAKLPGAAPYLRRFEAYELAACLGCEKEAYAHLQKLYEESVSERTPRLLAMREQCRKLATKNAKKNPSGIRYFKNEHQ